MQRPIGVTLLAIAAGLGGLFQIWKILIFLGIVDFTFFGETVSFADAQWGPALWSLLLAGIWFWVAKGLWEVRAYAWQFGLFISLFTMIFGFFDIITSRATSESEIVGWLLAMGVFFYLNYPGVRDHFIQNELSRLTPEQRVALEAAARANAAAERAMRTPATAAAVSAPAAAVAAPAPAVVAPAPAASAATPNDPTPPAPTA